jgi:hypothetical protein
MAAHLAREEGSPTRVESSSRIVHEHRCDHLERGGDRAVVRRVYGQCSREHVSSHETCAGSIEVTHGSIEFQGTRRNRQMDKNLLSQGP